MSFLTKLKDAQPSMLFAEPLHTAVAPGTNRVLEHVAWQPAEIYLASQCSIVVDTLKASDTPVLYDYTRVHICSTATATLVRSQRKSTVLKLPLLPAICARSKGVGLCGMQWKGWGQLVVCCMCWQVGSHILPRPPLPTLNCRDHSLDLIVFLLPGRWTQPSALSGRFNFGV